ncbi:metal dependent phosphohydrolase [Pseudaminobacter salicylatoxidans]|uniref:Metal dependent phosphohydrolase n=1 Tax=Pseudaminobacter salicylatoxidans TaxID=93369 RepID=A0A316BNE0_PSESE|nr:HD domain-containing protein [Pseudaminobacter salicylatoxidans]PWJ74476.1 metal dependent phosphohydrolase [Pseudaminobacter salicylatoxidans]
MGKRLRDPVHGLIVFDEKEPIDMLAWKLIDTPEFQRLRRIRQLGVSEFTFPGAVHSRFAHSIGVFHTARTLVKVLEREMKRNEQEFNNETAQVALAAALLHDLGHGPFSHTFEGVQESRGVKKRHEKWTADIIRNPSGRVRPLLEAHRVGFTEEVAALLEKEDPEDIYHAIVSSSFDADRLDYIRRDKLMTGTGAGGIDFDWLIENVRVAEIEIDAPDEDGSEPRRVQTFCLTAKARPAAEQFLLARYTLHQQVYFHKATRCLEHMISKLLRAVARLASGKKGEIKKSGLSETHPLIRFFAKDGETVENYLALDDALILGAIDAMSQAEDADVAEIATRLRERKLYKTLDLAEFGKDSGTQRNRLRRIREKFGDQIKAETVMLDDKAAIGIYAEIGGDDERMHKKLHIFDGERPVEISRLSKLIEALESKEQFTRFYFSDPAERDAARK